MFIRWKLPLLILFFTVFLSVQAEAEWEEYDRQIEAQLSELAQIRVELEKLREETEQLKGKKVGILAELNRLDRELYLLRKFLRRLERSQRELQRDIKRTQAQLATTEKALKAQQQRFAQRLRQIYKQGRLHSLEVLLTADSFPKLLRRYRGLCLLAEQDRRTYLGIKEKKRRIERVQARLEAKLWKNLKLEQEKAREERNLKRRQQSRNRLLHLVQTQIQTSQRAAAELEAEEQRIRELIARLEQARKEQELLSERKEEARSTYDFAGHKGRMIWPTQGRVETYFGKQRHPKLKTTTINKGIDIAAPYGAEIRAVAPGRVAIVDWVRGYGKFLIIDHHNGYYTLYAHASEILVVQGEEVTEGEVIARVGDTGSLKGPMLHFEIRRGNRELDPLEWLR